MVTRLVETNGQSFRLKIPMGERAGEKSGAFVGLYLGVVAAQVCAHAASPFARASSHARSVGLWTRIDLPMRMTPGTSPDAMSKYAFVLLISRTAATSESRSNTGSWVMVAVIFFSRLANTKIRCTLAPCAQTSVGTSGHRLTDIPDSGVGQFLNRRLLNDADRPAMATRGACRELFNTSDGHIAHARCVVHWASGHPLPATIESRFTFAVVWLKRRGTGERIVPAEQPATVGAQDAPFAIEIRCWLTLYRRRHFSQLP